MTVVVGPSVSVVGSTVALSTLVARIRRKYLNDEPWQDTLGASQTSGATTINLTNGAVWAVNDLIESALDGELERISPATMPLSNPITVKRAHDGTTAAAHSSGDVVYKNPRFRYGRLSDTISEVATNETWPDLWAVASLTFTPSPTTTNLYDITDSAFRNPIGAVQKSTSTIESISALSMRPVDVRDVPASVSTTGKAIYMPSFDNLTNDVTVYYQAQITASTIPEGDVSEWILLRAAARTLRALAVQETGRDTQARNQKGQVSELVGMAENFERDAVRIRSRAKVNLNTQWTPQLAWTREWVGVW